MAAPLIPGTSSSSSARKARRESVVPIGIDAEFDASLLAHDDTFYGDDKYDAGAAAPEWSDSGTGEDTGGASTSVLRHGSNLTLAILRPCRVETKQWTLNPWTTRFFPYLIKTAMKLQVPSLCQRCAIGKILDVDARSQIATLTSTSISSSVSHLKQETSKQHHMQYIIGQLSASMHTTASTAKKQEYFYRYHILGEPVCKSAFLEVNGIGDHVY